MAKCGSKKRVAARKVNNGARQVTGFKKQAAKKAAYPILGQSLHSLHSSGIYRHQRP